MQKITPNLWFDKDAEEAVNLYVSLFPNSTIKSISRFGKEGFEFHQMPEGTVMTVDFELNGQKFLALNGGPVFKFTEAVSFIIDCKDQEEVDHYWNGLIADGGEESQCGWCKDKFGLSWQVVPEQFKKLMSSGTPDQSSRVMNAMFQMKKFDIAKLQAAYDGE